MAATLKSINPATEEVNEEFEHHSDSAINERLETAAVAFRTHRHTAFSERAGKMTALAGLLEDGKEKWGRILTEEMGKPIGAAIAEVEKCAWVCRYYADNAEDFLSDEDKPSDASRSFVRNLPIGPVLAVMPWNFPFWQVFRFAAPAVMAGNVGLLKHASNVPRSALAIEELFREAGFDGGVFQTLLIGSGPIERILADDRVRAATLTGSEGAGSAVAAAAGKAIKKTVLELGGSDAFIVMPSADIDAAVETAVTARTINNGQSCIAAKRFLVHRDVYDAFADAFVAGFEALSIGDPLDEATDIGPLATASIRDEVAEQVDASVKAGARRLTGAETMEGTGYFYRPGILSDIPGNTPAADDEVFGPVALLYSVSSLEDAIAIANGHRYGLGSSIWTRDEGEIDTAANDIEAGATFVNAMVASDPRLPFGGVKGSGFGRELGAHGIRELCNIKTVYVA